MIKPTLPIPLVVLSAIAVCAAPPTPPSGKKWVQIPSLSDEFNGNSLNTNKWINKPPGWQGRPPARFTSDTVKVEGGYLKITNYKLNSPEVFRGQTFTMACGRVVSKTTSAFYGYYECRMKASDVSMSSTFWLANNWDNPNSCPRNRQELDIIETAGDKDAFFSSRMNSNTHFRRLECGQEKEVFYSRGDGTSLGGGQSNDKFHTYGAWWVDANTIHFYLNDKYVYTINPRRDFSNTPFNRPMQLNMVTETYDWLTPPTNADFANSNKSKTTLYEWVRSWKLENSSGGSGIPINKTVAFKSSGNQKYVASDKSLDAINWPLAANRPNVGGSWEKFKILDAGGGKVSIQATGNNQFVSADKFLDSVNWRLAANRPGVGAWEKFTWINNSDGTVSLRAQGNNDVVAADRSLNVTHWPLAANRPNVAGSWEKFTIQNQ